MFFYTFCIIPHHNVEFTKLGIKRVNQHSKPIHLKYNIYGRSRGVTTPPPFDFLKKCIHKNSYFPFGAYEFSIHMERMSKESDVEKYVKILF